MKALRFIFTILAVFSIYTLALAQATDTLATGQPVEFWLDTLWKVLGVFGIIEVIVRFFTKYRGILGTVIRVLIWIEDHTQRKVTNIGK